MRSSKAPGTGNQFPPFSPTGVVSNDIDDAFTAVTGDDEPGRGKVVCFWPKDFTFVCPTEIPVFGALGKAFRARDARPLGAHPPGVEQGQE
jgi:alkyl hydroperoxide reductase subunit AhpC